MVKGWDRELRGIFQRMSVAYLECRDLGHPWRRRSTVWDHEAREYRSVAACPQCGTQRTRVLNASGEVVSSYYDYPDGYSIEGIGGLDKRDRSLMRLIILQREANNAAS
jgi:hypothetical protein